MILCTLLPDQNLKLWHVSDTAKTRSRTVKREAAAWGGGGGKGGVGFHPAALSIWDSPRAVRDSCPMPASAVQLPQVEPAQTGTAGVRGQNPALRHSTP